jgi:hypothetical protein
MDKSKGKGSALLAFLGRKKPSLDEDKGDLAGSTSDEPSSPDMGEGDDTSSMAVDDLADAIGVPERHKADFASSFKAAVKACIGGDSEPSEPSAGSGF